MRKTLYAILALLLVATFSYSDSEVTIGGKTGAAHIIQANGTSLRPRPYLNITGDAVTGVDYLGKTVITIDSSTDEVGAVTLNKWCIGDGTAVQCTEDEPAGAGGGASDAFQTWDLPDGDNIVADVSTDTATFTATEGISITGTAATDALVFGLTFKGHATVDSAGAIGARPDLINFFTAATPTTGDSMLFLDATDNALKKGDIDDVIEYGGGGSSFTDIDTDYGNETVTSTWNFIDVGTGGLTDYDLKIGDTTTPDYGVLQIGGSSWGRTSYSGGSLDIGGATMINNQGALDAGNNPGIEFLLVEGGNTIRMAIPESGAGNAMALIRSVTVAGPMALNNNIVLCDTWSTYDSNIDCDTGGTGADLFVQDDLEVEGEVFLSGSIYGDADDADQHQIAFANATADRLLTIPDDTIAAGDVLFGTGAGTFGYDATPALDCTDCTNYPEADPNVDSHAEIIAIIDNTATDVGTGVWTFAGVTMAANENLTLGGETVDHDGTDFVFSDSVKATTSFIIGSADMSETDLEKLDGITNGTAAANKAVVLDASLDIATINSLTATTLTDGTFSVTGGAITGASIDPDQLDDEDQGDVNISSDVWTVEEVTISDDESTDDAHEIVFTTDNAALESDGDLTYNPSTGTLDMTIATVDSVYLAENENLYMGSKTMDYDGTNFVFSGTLASSDFPAIGNDPDVATAGYIGRDNDDHWLRGYDGTIQFIYGQKTKVIAGTVTNPDLLTEAAFLPIWTNQLGASFVIDNIYAVSDVDDAAFTLKYTTNGYDDHTNLTTVEAITISTDSTGIYSYTIAFVDIDNATLADGVTLGYDAGATDCDFIHFAIEGHLLGDVN